MPLTPKQTYVLNNIDRARVKPVPCDGRSRRSTYEMDGWDCTPQINTLIIKRYIAKRECPAIAQSVFVRLCPRQALRGKPE